ncbi:LuxR family transcriptional regulator [Kribbella sancticallisti]|uniref:LuxR family transcriptional regulator n=1 Tax=Kribbella sancticallisti TaxID=460087 RepID=A0ABN2CA78_9ACTN
MLVRRERLYSALDRGSRSALTMLVAPAGTGKTVLLSDWAARYRAAGHAVLWVAAQEPGAVEETLLKAAGANRAEPDSGRPAQPDTASALVDALVDAVDPAAAPDPVVVDDAHLLPAATVATLAQVLADAPHTIRLLLASRHDLPLPVLELELKGQASTLRSRDLRFTDSEAAALVHAHAENATDQDVAMLQRKTAGWAAALVLAARAIAGPAGSKAASAAILTTEQPVLDLLLGETLGKLQDRIQAVLLSTFRARSVTGHLAEVLSGDADAGAMLEDLAGNGLLVTMYADPGSEPTYRFHPLLVELLRRRVVGNPGDGRLVTAAHHRAAVYYEDRGQGDEALRNAIASDDAGLVARVLVSHGPAVMAGGDLNLVAAGFEALPDGYVATHPHLLGVRGLRRRLTGDMTGAVMDAASADEATAASPSEAATPDDDALEADALLLRLWRSRYGWYDVHDAIARAREVLVLERPATVGQHKAILGPERLSWLLIELAAAETWAGELEAALGHLGEALVSARMAGHRQLIGSGLAHRAVVEFVGGQVHTAERSALAALDAFGDSEMVEDYGVRAHVVLGLAAVVQLDVAAAPRWYRLVESADVGAADTVVDVLRVMLRAVILMENGRLDEARAELASDPASAGPLPSFLARDLALLRFAVAVLTGDPGAVAAQLDALDRTGNDSEAELIRALSTILQGDNEATIEAIDAALARPTVHPVLAASAVAVRAVLLLRSGDETAAEVAMVDALNRVAPQRTFLALTAAGREPAFLDLLRRHAQALKAHPFASTALTKLSDYRPGWSEAGGSTMLDRTRPVAPPEPPPRRLDAVINGARIQLTAREADVLDELALGSSYTEIAQALFVTENTVKTHIMALYRKLGVEKRSAALRVARSVHLL